MIMTTVYRLNDATRSEPRLQDCRLQINTILDQIEIESSILCIVFKFLCVICDNNVHVVVIIV